MGAGLQEEAKEEELERKKARKAPFKLTQQEEWENWVDSVLFGN